MKITSTSKVFYMIFSAFILFTSFLSAQIPTYYSGVDFTKEGDALKSELSTLIINTHTTLIPYTSGSTDTWDVVHESDADVSVPGNVVLIYGYDDTDGVSKTDRTRAISLQQGSGAAIGRWNREHVFAKSLANPKLETSPAGPGTDVHNLRAADFQMNGYRSNRHFNVGSGNSFEVDIPDHPICDKAPFGNPPGCFYPGDEFRGDVARIMMYMYIRYPTQCEPTNIGIGSASYSDLADMPDIFLEWNKEDPVSVFETNRNNVIASYQGNRNPFIDNPYLATLVWNGPDAEDIWGVLSAADVAVSSVFIYPTVVEDFVTIKGLDVSKSSIKIYNQIGQALAFDLDTNRIDVSAFSKGLYLMNIQQENQSKTVKFLVK